MDMALINRLAAMDAEIKALRERIEKLEKRKK